MNQTYDEFNLSQSKNRLDSAKSRFETLLLHDTHRAIDGSPLLKGFNSSQIESSMAGDQNVVDISEKDKDEAIFFLQEENEKLKQQLDQLLTSVEVTLQEAQITNEQIVTAYVEKLSNLQYTNDQLRVSNDQLSQSAAGMQRELDEERKQLLQALQLLDRYHKRSQSYIEIQQKSNHVLLSLDRPHYIASNNNSSNHNTSAAQQQQSKFS